LVDCKDCLYSKRIDHLEHGAWHGYYCKLLRNAIADMGPVECQNYISVKPKPGTNLKKMREYLNKEFSNE